MQFELAKYYRTVAFQAGQVPDCDAVVIVKRGRQDLGYEPTVPLLAGLNRTVSAYQSTFAHRDHLAGKEMLQAG